MASSSFTDEALLQRAAYQAELFERVRASFPDGPTRWFGHVRVSTNGGERDLLLSTRTQAAPGLALLDWQHAPLAEVFFGFDEGDAYEVELGDRVVGGTVLERNLVWFAPDGALVRLECGGGAVARTGPDGALGRVVPIRAIIPPRPAAEQQAFRSPLEVELDEAQRRVVELPQDAHVLLLGEAGFGKTTVALHRLAALVKKGGRRFNAAVVVPTEGLRRLTEQMLARRHVPGVEVFTYDAFARTLARRAFVDLPRREGQSQSGAVVKLKRHRALRAVLAAFATQRPKPAVDPDRPTRSKALARRADLEHLFGDRAWTRRVVEMGEGEVPLVAVEDAAEHARIQFLDRAELEFGHVDAASLVTVDGRKLDEGTPTEDANSIDPEDYAVLFELERLRSKAAGSAPARVANYDCIVVDEAQELAPLELSLVGRAIRPGGTLIVAGDAAQQVDASSDFTGWEQVMRDAFADPYERAVLAVSYRCPDEVTSLARAILDPSCAHPSDGAVIQRAQHASSFHLAAWLVDALRELEAADPTASVAVIARTPAVARALFRTLRLGLGARLSLGGDFEFRPGVAVSAVPEVKGLEFDHIVLPDADAQTYPAVAEARRALYVALTRATHTLTLSTSGLWSPLLPSPRTGRGPG